MPTPRTSKITFTLAIIAAALAFAAAAIEYAARGTVNLSVIAGGLFMLAFGWAARKGIWQ